jgi:hypothetical protein
MRVDGNYERAGFALIEGLLAPEIAQAFLGQLKRDLEATGKALSNFYTHAPIQKKVSVDIYGHDYPPMLQLLWGLTPAMCALTERDLLPTYNYFRLYRQNDVCRVHADRPSCEHSLSLTLAYSDDMVWAFEVGTAPAGEPGPIEDDFGDAPSSTLLMRPGDAVLYKGVVHRHGRTTPNPNRWSAHLFLHWVDRNGPHADHAFDHKRDEAAIDFTF